jgi:hypothetical protein
MLFRKNLYFRSFIFFSKQPTALANTNLVCDMKHEELWQECKDLFFFFLVGGSVCIKGNADIINKTCILSSIISEIEKITEPGLVS